VITHSLAGVVTKKTAIEFSTGMSVRLTYSSSCNTDLLLLDPDTPKLVKLVVGNFAARRDPNVSESDTPTPAAQLHPKTANEFTL
jgi:hypothetical protein